MQKLVLTGPESAAELRRWLRAKMNKRNCSAHASRRTEEPRGSRSLPAEDKKNNGTRPCEETSSSWNNRKHVATINNETLELCILLCCRSRPTSSSRPSMTSFWRVRSLWPGTRNYWANKQKKKKKSFNFFFPGVVASQKNTLLTWLWAEMCNCRH